MKARRSFTKPASSSERRQLTQEQWGLLLFIFETPFTFIGMILFNVFPPGVPLMMACLVALAAIVVYRDRKRLKQVSRAERNVRELRWLVQQASQPKEAREVSWDEDISLEGGHEGRGDRMNQGWHKNFWIFATVLLLLGTTGILQAYIFSQEQPEEGFFVLSLLVASSLFLIISLPLLIVFVMSMRRVGRLEGRVGDAVPGRGDSASSVREGVSEDGWPMKWLRKDMIVLVLAITGFVAGISRLFLNIDDITSHRVSGSITISSMIIAGLYLGCSVLFFAVYGHRKKKPRSMEAPSRLARSRGQPKEAREE